MGVAARLGAVIGLAALLAGCTSPPPALYTIAVVPGPTVPRSPDIVVVRDVNLARYLERIPIVVSSESYRLDVRANDWWGEPLTAMLSRVLVQELGQRLPASNVYAENGAVSTEPDATVELNIQRLDEDSSGQLVLIAQVGVIRRGGGAGKRSADRTLRRNLRIAVTPASSGVPAQVAATSSAVGQLADAIAAMLAGP